MQNKTCGECGFFSNSEDRCLLLCGRGITYTDDDACRKFEQKRSKVITNGDRIIAGGMRELAKAMVYGYRETDDSGQVTDGMLYTWHLPNAKVFTEYNEAVDYLEAWLNAPADVCVKQNGNHDTQPGLCVADNTESEVE